MGVGNEGKGAVAALWIFTQDTDFVNSFFVFFAIFRYFSAAPLPPPGRGLIVLFSVFFAIFRSFFRYSPLEFFLPTPLHRTTNLLFQATSMYCIYWCLLFFVKQ